MVTLWILVHTIFLPDSLYDAFIMVEVYKGVKDNLLKTTALY